MAKFKGNFDSKEAELIKRENNNLKPSIKSDEEWNNIINHLEKKLRTQQAKFDKDIKDLEVSYKEKIKNYLCININNKKSEKDENLSRNMYISSKMDKDDKLDTKTTTSIINVNILL